MSFASRALTQTETRYAKIEKELLAIVFACEKFDKYIFGRDVVNVETDHKPLEEIFNKSLCDAPARLQRMLLRLQRYNLKVRYKKGPLMLIADTLSSAYLRDTLPSEEVKSLEVVDHSENLRVSPSRLPQIEQESVQDQFVLAFDKSYWKVGLEAFMSVIQSCALSSSVQNRTIVLFFFFLFFSSLLPLSLNLICCNFRF